MEYKRHFRLVRQAYPTAIPLIVSDTMPLGQFLFYIYNNSSYKHHFTIVPTHKILTARADNKLRGYGPVVQLVPALGTDARIIM